MRKVIVCFLLLLAGCQEHAFNMEQEGKQVHVSQEVSFYCPRSWQFTRDDMKLSAQAVKGDEVLYFNAFEVGEDNGPEELLALYMKELEGLGIVDLDSQSGELDDGQPCFFVWGRDPGEEAGFYEAVVFQAGRQYIYSYLADTGTYDEHLDEMKLYLKTLVIR